MEAPGEPGLDEPLLPTVEPSDSFEGELELAYGEPFDAPAWFEFEVEKSFALPASPEDWEEDPMFVGAE